MIVEVLRDGTEKESGIIRWVGKPLSVPTFTFV